MRDVFALGLVGLIMLPFLAFPALFAFLAIRMATRTARFGGFKGAMFGGRVLWTSGEVTGIPAIPGPFKTRSTGCVHRIETEFGPAITLEIVHRNALSYRMVPMTLAPDQAARLVTLLQQALAG